MPALLSTLPPLTLSQNDFGVGYDAKDYYGLAGQNVDASKLQPGQREALLYQGSKQNPTPGRFPFSRLPPISIFDDEIKYCDVIIAQYSLGSCSA